MSLHLSKRSAKGATPAKRLETMPFKGESFDWTGSSDGRGPDGVLAKKVTWMSQEVGGSNPFEKYARQIGSFPQIGMKMDENKKCLKPPAKFSKWVITPIYPIYK